MKGDEIFIVGSKGQLGLALQKKYPNAASADIDEMDITDRASVESFNWSKIKIILNAAAYTNVDGAETNEGRIATWSVNAGAVANLVRVAIKHNMVMVHVSTDYVFDGSKAPHDENEPFSPLSVYGASKAAGDIVLSLLPKHYLLRTSWVIGEGKNFVRAMIELGQKGVSPKVVADQIGRPTFTNTLVDAIHHLLATRHSPLATKGDETAPYGTYNISNSGEPVSWADLARTIFKAAGFEQNVTDTTTKEYFANKPEAAPRPLNSTFNLAKIKQTGFTPKNWQESLKEYIKKELQK